MAAAAPDSPYADVFAEWAASAPDDNDETMEEAPAAEDAYAAIDLDPYADEEIPLGEAEEPLTEELIVEADEEVAEVGEAEAEAEVAEVAADVEEAEAAAELGDEEEVPDAPALPPEDEEVIGEEQAAGEEDSIDAFVEAFAQPAAAPAAVPQAEVLPPSLASSPTAASSSGGKSFSKGKSKGKGKEPAAGYLFLCGRLTSAESRRHKIMASIGRDLQKMRCSINNDTQLFLFDMHQRHLIGRFSPVGEPLESIVPNAFQGQFPAQLRVRPCDDPLLQAQVKHKVNAGPMSAKDVDTFMAMLRAGEPMSEEAQAIWKMPFEDEEESATPATASEAEAKRQADQAVGPPGKRPRVAVTMAELERKERLKKLREQVEYYLSDVNLEKDAFFHGKLSQDPEGWMDASWVLGCKRVRMLEVDEAELEESLIDSHLDCRRFGDDAILQLRRPEPLPALLAAPQPQPTQIVKAVAKPRVAKTAGGSAPVLSKVAGLAKTPAAITKVSAVTKVPGAAAPAASVTKMPAVTKMASVTKMLPVTKTPAVMKAPSRPSIVKAPANIAKAAVITKTPSVTKAAPPSKAATATKPSIFAPLVPAKPKAPVDVKASSVPKAGSIAKAPPGKPVQAASNGEAPNHNAAFAGEPGYVFITSKATHAECKDRGMLAALEWDLEKLQRMIGHSTKIFVYNQSTARLMGVFQMCGLPAKNLVPGAFGGKFTSHIKVTPLHTPLKEVKTPRPLPGPQSESQVNDHMALLEMQGDEGETWPMQDAVAPVSSVGAVAKAKGAGIAKNPPATAGQGTLMKSGSSVTAPKVGIKAGSVPLPKTPAAGQKRPASNPQDSESVKRAKKARENRKLPLKRQVEFLLSERSLKHDESLHKLVKESADNWIDSSVVLCLKKVAALGVQDPEELEDALQDSQSVETQRLADNSIQLRPRLPPPALEAKPGWLAKQAAQRQTLATSKPKAVAATPKAPVAQRPLRIGDVVRVRSGEYQGQIGSVANVEDEDISVVVGGMNLVVLFATELDLQDSAQAAAEPAEADAEEEPAAVAAPPAPRPVVRSGAASANGAPPSSSLQQVLVQKREKLRKLVTQKEVLSPFLQPGRLIHVNDGNDWGWGVCISKEAIAEGSFEVFLLVEPGSLDTGSPVPPKVPAKASGEKLCVPLASVLRVSKVRVKVQSESSNEELLTTLRQVLNHPKFKDGSVPELDPVSEMKIQSQELPRLWDEIKRLEARGATYKASS
mmetsp:Transcript_9688/g.21643  ORF Transcript_9688/g.21643 Transcript_9688/m.21643 type:complete len:1235 (+) Transcript_9688:39-3743(+)